MKYVCTRTHYDPNDRKPRKERKVIKVGDTTTTRPRNMGFWKVEGSAATAKKSTRK